MTAAVKAGIDQSKERTKLLKFYDVGEALQIARDWLVEPEHQDALLAADGDLDALPELALLLEQAEADFAAKAENVALMAREFDLTADAIKSEVDRLGRMHKTAVASAKGLKTYLRIWFLKANVKKVEGTRAKPRIQINPPAIASTLTAEELSQLAAMESPFVRTVRPAPVVEIDRERILETYKSVVAAVETTLGKSPDVGEIDYHARRERFDAALQQALTDAGVPAGITVERGFHTRIS